MNCLFVDSFKKFIFLSVLLTFLSINKSFAQERIKTNNHGNFFSFAFDNDVYFNTDEYYTNGFFLSLSNRKNKLNDFENLMFPFSFGSGFTTFSVSQKIYTPRDFSTDDIKYGDRPFAANLELQYSLQSYSGKKNLILTESFLLGVVGKYAFGKEVQNGIHSFLPHSSDVPGWENQISSGMLLGYSMEVEKKIFEGNIYVIDMLAFGKLGTPQTSFGIGTHLVVNSVGEYFQRPNYFTGNTFGLQFDFSMKTSFKLYDVNLQGNLFWDSSPYRLASISRFVIEGDSGFQLKLNRFIMEIRAYYLSSEFPGGTKHLWGRFKIGVKF